MYRAGWEQVGWKQCIMYVGVRYVGWKQCMYAGWKQSIVYVGVRLEAMYHVCRLDASQLEARRSFKEARRSFKTPRED